MDATAPVAPDVPWASAKCVEASKEATTSAERFKGKLGVKWFWLICVILHAYGIMPQSNILFRTGAAILLMWTQTINPFLYFQCTLSLAGFDVCVNFLFQLKLRLESISYESEKMVCRILMTKPTCLHA